MSDLLMQPQKSVPDVAGVDRPGMPDFVPRWTAFTPEASKIRGNLAGERSGRRTLAPKRPFGKFHFTGFSQVPLSAFFAVFCHATLGES